MPMQRRPARILRWVLLAALALPAVAALTFELISWNFLRGPIEERFEAATGRALAIDGELSLSLIPRPVAEVNALTVDNPPWADAANLLKIERLRVRPSLWAALTGKVVFSSVTIEAPRLNLERRNDGVDNWTFPESDGASPDAAADAPLIIRELSMSAARLRYRAADQPPLALSIPSLQMDDDGESAVIRASLALREKAFELEAMTDSLHQLGGGHGEFGGELAVDAEQGKMESTFTLAQTAAFQGSRIDWQLELTDLADWSQWAGQPPIDLQGLSLGSRLDIADGEWHFSDIEAALAGSRVTGEVSIDTSGPDQELNAMLSSPELDVAELLAALPDNAEAVDSPVQAIPVLPELTANMALSVDTLLLDRYRASNLEAELSLKDRFLTLTALEFDVAGGSVVANADLSSNREALALDAALNVDNLQLASLDATSDMNGVLAGRLAFSLQGLARQPAPGIKDLLARLRIEQASASYIDSETRSDLQAELDIRGQLGTPQLSVAGDFRDQPIEATFSGDPLPALAGAPEDYALKARMHSGAIRIELDTHLASLVQPQTLSADFELSADNIRNLQPWLQRPLPSVPGLLAAGRLERNAGQWDATALRLEAGDSRVVGEMGFRNAQRPFVRARLHATRLDPLAFTVGTGAADEQVNGAVSGRGTDSTDENNASILSALRAVDARFDLRIDQLDLPGDPELHRLVVSGALENGSADIDPARFEIAGGDVSATLVLEVEEQRAFGKLETRFSDIVLDRLGDTLTPLEDRLGRLSGTLNLEVTETRADAPGSDLLFPFIGRLRFQESRLRFENPDTNTDLTLNLQTEGLDDGDQEFQVDGSGHYDDDRFTLRFRGDELLHARDPERPYAMDFSGEIVESRFSFSGTVLRPLALEGLNLALSLEGPNPQSLSRVLGIPFPLLPAYSVSADLSLDESRWMMQGLTGRVGDSDLSGQLSIDGGTRPPHISGRLESDAVRMEDLSGVFGARPGGDGPRSDGSLPEDRLVLPQRPLITDAWADVTADVRYRGRSLRAGDIPFSDVVIHFLLDDGRLQFAPVGFGVGAGSVDFNLDLNVRDKPSHGTLEASVRGVDLQAALSEWELTENSVGIVGGQGKFWVEGDSIADIFASADGGMLLLMRGGRLDAVLVEMAGLDATQVFTSLLRDRDPIPVDCVYIDAKTRDGLATFDTFVIDTEDTLFTAGGELNFADERLDMTLLANPKDASVGVARSPIQISGTFNDIALGIGAGGLGARLGGAALLGALATPVALLLPLLDVGAGEDSGYCEGLTRRSQDAFEDPEDP